MGACAGRGGAFLAALETPEENERVKTEIRRRRKRREEESGASESVRNGGENGEIGARNGEINARNGENNGAGNGEKNNGRSGARSDENSVKKTRRNWALGATDEHAEGKWAWLTTEGFVKMTYGDWMEGKPDNGRGGRDSGRGGTNGEHYLQMNGANGDLKWDDVGNVDSHFICEYNPWKDRRP